MKNLKSKIATWALVLCSVVSCMFMLTACGNNDTPDDNTPDVTTVTYTVADEQAWNEVLTGDYLKNGTVNMDGKCYSNGELVPEESLTQIMKSTSQSMYMTYAYNDGEAQEQFLVNEEGTWYGLTKVGDIWYGMPQGDAAVESYTFAGSQGKFYVDRFEEFEYDEANHCYVANDFVVDEESAEYVKIYIEDGKLAKIEMKGNIDETTYMIAESVFSNYGTTTIAVPEWTPAPEQE